MLVGKGLAHEADEGPDLLRLEPARCVQDPGFGTAAVQPTPEPEPAGLDVRPGNRHRQDGSASCMERCLMCQGHRGHPQARMTTSKPSTTGSTARSSAMISRSISGKAATNPAAIRPITRFARRTGTLTRSLPRGTPERPLISSPLCTSSASSGPIRRCRTRPSSVRWSSRPPRSNRRVPSSASRVRIRRDSVALGMPVVLLAAAKPPELATALKSASATRSICVPSTKRPVPPLVPACAAAWRLCHRTSGRPLRQILPSREWRTG